MAISKVCKSVAGVAMVLGLTAVMAMPAHADGSVAWNGVRGLDSIVPCLPDQDPYLHWIFTPGGQADLESATLWIDGIDYTGEHMGEGNGAFHFFTPSTVALTDVHVTYEGTAGRNALVTISDGCRGVQYPS